jgi:hypothetical protein
VVSLGHSQIDWLEFTFGIAALLLCRWPLVLLLLCF